MEHLAERAGIELPRVGGAEQEAILKARSRKEALAGIMESATAFFEAQLREHRHAKLAVQEYTRRKITHETAKTFRLGYAPEPALSPGPGSPTSRSAP